MKTNLRPIKNIIIVLAIIVSIGAVAEIKHLPPREQRQTQQQTPQQEMLTGLLPPRWLEVKRADNGTVIVGYNNRSIDAQFYEVQRKLPMWRWVTKGKALPSETAWVDVKPSKDWAKYRMRAVNGKRKGAWNKPITFYP